jgi:DNA-directed RNA polymerase specialized sigma24 family protein
MNDIFEKAKKGNEKAEQELFRELFVRFRHFAIQRVDEETAKEVAQRACVTVLEKYKTETFTVSFQAWAYGVMKMTLLKVIQSESRQSMKELPIIDGFEPPQSESVNPMLRTYLLECIKWLAGSYTKYARILNLRYLGYNTDEICDKLKVSSDQYYVYVGRGRSLLRDCLEKKGALS